MLALVPLDTLPGWPHADNPSVTAILFLLIGLPVAAGAVITVLGMGPRWRRSRPEQPYADDTIRAMEAAAERNRSELDAAPETSAAPELETATRE